MTGGTYPALGFDPCPGDPDGVTHLASRWQDAAMLLTEAALKLDRTDADQDGWKGKAADAFRTSLNTQRTMIGKLRSSYETNATLLSEWSGRLGEFQGRARVLERRASQAQGDLRASRVPQIHVPAPTGPDAERIKGYQTDLDTAKGLAHQLNADYLAAAQAIAREINRHDALPSGTRGWYGQSVDQKQATLLLGQAACRKDGILPVDEAERAQWWASLPVAMQQQLTRNDNAAIGNANGLPAQVRSDANMVSLRRALTAAKARNDNTRATALTDILNAMTNPQAKLHRQPMYLLGFDENGNGHAIVCYGNPDTAANTAVYVPGTGTKLDKMQGDIGRASTMYDAAQKDSSDPTASMVWLGYDAPQWLTGPAEARYADAGGPLLAGYVNSLSLTHHGPSHVTVIGHSYGSTVVGAALGHYGMRADDAVFVGSPGVTVNHASDLHLDPSHVWAGHMQNDVVPMVSLPVSPNPARYLDDYSERFGTDPVSREFGAHAFACGYGQESPVSSHSDYWNAGTPSLTNMTHIVTGDYHSVTAASNMERDGNEPTSPIGGIIQLPAWELTQEGHLTSGLPGTELQHTGQAMSQVGHGVGAGVGAVFDVATGDLPGAVGQVGDVAHDVAGVTDDLGHVIVDPLTEVGNVL